MKWIVLLMVALSVQVAHAEIQGTWNGWGDWLYEGSGDHCQLQLVFTETSTELHRKSGSFACSVVGLTLPEETWMKKGDQLLANGKVVGHFTPTSFEIEEAYSEKVTIQTTIARSALHLDYHEVWLQKDHALLYDIKGRLFLHE